ncbi:MAG: DUF262 domain-containing HNH endonuclease family protein [Bryobacterales bacterium]|nr:DUF262 domain-containing HNH endonuclease family protein [Bryobacterales bacterium]
MRADPFRLEVVLGEKQQWVVPVYQRHYEWETNEDKQIPKLWEDLQDQAEERLDGRRAYPHYFGAIIYSEPSGQRFGTIRKRYLVDGQQRITTFELVLITIREIARERQIPQIQDVVETYLFNDLGKGMVDPVRERYKLWSSAYDRQLYRTIADNPRDSIRDLENKYFYKNGNLKKGQAPNLLRAYWFLFEAMNELIDDRVKNNGSTAEDVLHALLSGFLSGFQIVMIHLDENDDAQEIFASLNGMAKPLSPFDLIRNDVFHRARRAGEDDERLFEERWKEFESPFWSAQVRQGRFKRARADHFISHAVVTEAAREVNAGKIATEYQHYAREKDFPTVAEELDVLRHHAKTYRGMEELSDPVTTRLTRVLRYWDLSTFHPVVFWISAQNMEHENRESLFRLLENYILRRELCGLTTKNYNKVAITMIRSLTENNANATAFATDLLHLSGDASRMPSDRQVLESATTRAIYGNIPSVRLRYILQNIEYGKRTKFDETTLDSSNLTIEHLMPLRWAANWPLPNGTIAPCESTFQAALSGHALNDETRKQMELRQNWINTLGNLTLVTEALNPSLSNGPWKQKRARIGKSLLVLNREVAQARVWDEHSIHSRSSDLGALFVKLWPSY